MGVEAMSGRFSPSDDVFNFLEEGGRDPEFSEGSSHRGGLDDADSSDEGMDESSAAENKAFWELQRQRLKEALSRTCSTEIKLLQRVTDAVSKMTGEGIICSCSNRVVKECRKCAIAYVAGQLHELGYDSALCKSKWKKSQEIPSGEHTYVDVVMETRSGKRGPVRLVIELSFRAEFEMARGSHEYNSLVQCLPEIFAGKAETLRGVLKIVCEAAKQCMKDNKMHMAPWRKHKYMQSKWFGSQERTGPPQLAFPAAVPERRQPSKLRASMLTFDLHCTAVEVV